LDTIPTPCENDYNRSSVQLPHIIILQKKHEKTKINKNFQKYEKDGFFDKKEAFL
jgi:hypothetical protein